MTFRLYIYELFQPSLLRIKTIVETESGGGSVYCYLHPHGAPRLSISRTVTLNQSTVISQVYDIVVIYCVFIAIFIYFVSLSYILSVTYIKAIIQWSLGAFLYKIQLESASASPKNRNRSLPCVTCIMYVLRLYQLPCCIMLYYFVSRAVFSSLLVSSNFINVGFQLQTIHVHEQHCVLLWKHTILFSKNCSCAINCAW